MAQNTISQLERGERQAMPSTVRKLAEALGVEPSVLLVDELNHREREVLSLIQQGHSNRQVAEDLSMSLGTVRQYVQRIMLKLRDATLETNQQREALRNRGSRAVRAPTTYMKPLWLEREAQEARARREWFETGRWAEYYVSGECVRQAVAFAETHMADSDAEDRDLQNLVSEAEREYLQDMRSALRSQNTLDLAAVRSRLISNDPKETLHAAQAVLGRAKRLMEGLDNYSQSFRRIPDHYYADPIAHARILDVQQALAEQRVAAAEEIQELKNLYDEILDKLDEQIIGMREEGNVIEEFVTQAQDWGR